MGQLMPEYLSPGVYIEEVPSRIKAIEGVSTSTAGFVGAARRGPVAGLALPYQPDPGWTVQPDAAPILVTSYSEYVRQFGSAPLNPAERDEYLAHSVRAFFDNGGKRCF